MLCLYLVYMVYEKVRHHRPRWGDESYANFMVSILVDLGIVAMYMTAWIISYYYSREYTTDLIKDGIRQGNKIYYDYAEKGYWYYQAFIFDATSLLLIFVKMLWVFKISRQVSWMFEILESSI
jgi:hypothetical protein